MPHMHEGLDMCCQAVKLLCTLQADAQTLGVLLLIQDILVHDERDQQRPCHIVSTVRRPQTIEVGFAIKALRASCTLLRLVNAVLLISSAAFVATSSLPVHCCVDFSFQPSAQQSSFIRSAICSVLCLACCLMDTFQLPFGCINWHVANAFSSQVTAGMSVSHSLSPFKQQLCTAAWVHITPSRSYKAFSWPTLRMVIV